MFKDKALREHFGCPTPKELINKLLLKGEVDDLVNAINDLPHKDFNKEQLNLYIEVVFADALGNIDRTKNITKITFVKN